MAALISTCMLSGFAHATPPLSYDIYAGGFRAAEAKLAIDMDDDAYRIRLKAETKGLIGSLADWQGSYDSEGRVQDGKILPTTYKKESREGDEVSSASFTYNADGSLKSAEIVEDGRINKGLQKEVLADTDSKPDTMSAVLGIFAAVAKDGTCGQRIRAFNGKRSFWIQTNAVQQEPLTNSRYNSFAGTALKCTIEIEPIGDWGKSLNRGYMRLQTDSKARGRLPEIWLANVKGSPTPVPVRMAFYTRYGAVLGHITNAVADNTKDQTELAANKSDR